MYEKLGAREQSTLLVLDNVDDAQLLEDYLHGRPNNTQVVITTRDATLFEGRFPQLHVDVFD